MTAYATRTHRALTMSFHRWQILEQQHCCSWCRTEGWVYQGSNEEIGILLEGFHIDDFATFEHSHSFLLLPNIPLSFLGTVREINRFWYRRPGFSIRNPWCCDGRYQWILQCTWERTVVNNSFTIFLHQLILPGGKKFSEQPCTTLSPKTTNLPIIKVNISPHTANAHIHPSRYAVCVLAFKKWWNFAL